MLSSYLDVYLAGAAVQAHVYTPMFSLRLISQDFALWLRLSLHTCAQIHLPTHMHAYSQIKCWIS